MKDSKYIVDPNGERRAGCFGNAIRYGVGGGIIALLLWVLFGMCSCASTKNMEKTEYNDSTRTHIVYDTITVTITDTVRVEVHSKKETEDGTEINFGQGGGTYNSKTGEATNVASVKQSSKSTETEDLIREQKTQIDAFRATTDSLTAQVEHYASEVSKERQMPKRTSYDRFCSWWFWITAILLLLKLAAWVMEKIPATAPYILIARKFVPFL